MNTQELNIVSYNENTIYKITQFILLGGFKRAVDIFYDASEREVVTLGDVRLATLTPDAFNVKCATIGDCGSCHPHALLSNDALCLLANNGDFLIHNQ
jgi:hypothetical protein